MKVILLKDVASIGKKGDVKEVNQGHATNFLIPRKLAKPVNDAQVSTINLHKEQQKQDALIQQELAIKELHTLKGKVVLLKAKANEKGHLFSQIHTAEVLKAIREQHGVVLMESSLVLAQPIKETGEREVEVTLFGAKVSITLKVEAL